jgi:hypothetical protein
VFLSKEQQRILNDIIGKLGNKQSQDQTAGNDILELWNRFFQTDVRNGGMESETWIS